MTSAGTVFAPGKLFRWNMGLLGRSVKQVYCFRMQKDFVRQTWVNTNPPEQVLVSLEDNPVLMVIDKAYLYSPNTYCVCLAGNMVVEMSNHWLIPLSPRD